jgi:hypothetical protein
MGGSFEGMYKGDEGWATGGDRESMNNAFGKPSTGSGPLESPEENFGDRAMSPAALGDPANALPSVSSGAKPSSDDSFDCMADKYPTIPKGY